MKKWDSLKRRIKKALKEGWMLREKAKELGSLGRGYTYIYIGVQAEEWL